MADRSPDVQIVSPSPSPEEAAAVVAAVEQFLRDFATPAAPAAEDQPAPWLRAALLEGTGRDADALSPWGDPHPWG
jgi:hypothetical protein